MGLTMLLMLFRRLCSLKIVRLESSLLSLNMEEGEAAVTRWDDLDIDILVKIFQAFDIFELTSSIAQVCKTWRLACCDPLLWKTLNLSGLKSNFIKIPLEPYVYVHGRSDKSLTQILKLALDLSCGSILTLIFHYNLYISDEQLTYTAERYFPNPEKLVLQCYFVLFPSSFFFLYHSKPLESVIHVYIVADIFMSNSV